jgi:tight adherence protein C
MPVELLLTLVAVFISVALVSGTITSRVLSRTAPELKRLRPAMGAGDAEHGGSVLAGATVGNPLAPSLRKPRGRGSSLPRRLAMVGWDTPAAATLYGIAQIATPIAFGLTPIVVLGPRTGWLIGLVTGAVGYLLPDLLLSRKVAEYRRAIQNGLPDALDLLVVCVEAGSSLDQAILKASQELQLALPPLATELRMVSTEIRAGKPRLEAFQNFAKRTTLEDVQALVAMLIHTDRFGTSIGQALRTHADTLRTKRRQRAEERAGKIGVKLVFPLVLCMLPAMYVVCLGPVAIRLHRALQF